MSVDLDELQDQLDLRDRPNGRFESVVDFIVDEVKSAVVGQASERQALNAQNELVQMVWGTVGPLLVLRGPALDSHLLAIEHGGFVKFINRVAAERAFSRVRAAGARAQKLAELRPPSPGEAFAEQLGRRVQAFFEALDRHIRLRNPRIPAADQQTPILNRQLAAFTAVVVAGAVGDSANFTGVQRCADECIRACVEFGRLYHFRGLPELPEEAALAAAARADARAVEAHVERMAHMDDEFAEMGD